MPIQKVLKSNPNSTATLNSNLTGSFSTLRFFFGDASVCKGRTWQIVRNLLNFFHSFHVWYHEILTNLVIFRLRLLFLNLKIIRPHIRGRVSWTKCSKLLFISRVRPQNGLNNMNMISPLNLFHYLYHLRFKFDLNQKIPLNAINYLNIANRSRNIPNFNM